MTVGEQPEQQSVDEILLADNNMANLFAHRRDPLAALLYFGGNFLSRSHVSGSDKAQRDNVR
jgi:hypothetical protein